MPIYQLELFCPDYKMAENSSHPYKENYIKYMKKYLF